MELQQFNYIFSAKTKEDLADEHLWLSLLFKSPNGVFTRCQRLAVCVTLLLTTMVASAMYYQAVPKRDPGEENKLEHLVFSAQQVSIDC